MLAVNGVQIDRTSNDKYAKRVNEALKALYSAANIEPKKGRITLSLHSNHINSSFAGQDSHLLGMKFQPTKTIVVDGQSETWTYYTSKKHFKNEDIYEPKSLDFTSDGLVFSRNTDEDLLFFMVFISDKCEKVPSLAKYQNPEQAMASWKIELPELEARDFYENDRKIQMITNFIYPTDEDQDIDKLRVVAKAMGMSGTDNMSIQSLSVQLKRLAVSSVANMDLFLNNMDITPNTETAAVVQSAIEAGIIALDTRFGKKKWSYTTDGKLGGKEDKICDVLPGQQEKAVIVKYFMNNPTYFDVLKAKLVPETKLD